MMAQDPTESKTEITKKKKGVIDKVGYDNSDDIERLEKGLFNKYTRTKDSDDDDDDDDDDDIDIEGGDGDSDDYNNEYYKYEKKKILEIDNNKLNEILFEFISFSVGLSRINEQIENKIYQSDETYNIRDASSGKRLIDLQTKEIYQNEAIKNFQIKFRSMEYDLKSKLSELGFDWIDILHTIKEK